ncbi:NepR family anti-sigma factor [Rhizobium sp. BE258]|jgi:hypothetical protein|uniref:NepR family anti-sigma factor n=1 Tax=unclassified Rhizobium TaxID=2613769 RepID=UPI000DDBA12D|nr:NepR family anti-sigma factor [Rhizobium sp. BE258]MDR7144087.1 hypothetical protein [Rhizobium sp. BE258]
MATQQNEERDQQRLDVRASDILDPNNQIGVKLRSLYAAAQDEAIPDRFLDLLEKLDQAEMASAKLAE